MTNKPVRVVVYDVHPDDEEYFRNQLAEGYELEFTPDGLTEKTATLAQGAQVIAVHVSSGVTAGLMARMPELRHVACRSTGYDNVDLGYTGAHDIIVTNVPSYGQATVAEYAFMLMLALARRLLPAAQAVHTGAAAAPGALVGHDLAGKTLGVVGTGHIGRHAAAIGRGFGMKVLGFDLYPDAAAAKEFGYENVPLPDLLARSDYISLHAPGTPQTHHLIDAAAFKHMKRGAILINTARGSLIDTPALIEALESGRLAGAGLDVLEGEEFINAKSEAHLLGEKDLDDQARAALAVEILAKMPQVLISNHNAFNSHEALARIRQTTADNIMAARAGRPTNLVAAAAPIPAPAPAPK